MIFRRSVSPAATLRADAVSAAIGSDDTDAAALDQAAARHERAVADEHLQAAFGKKLVYFHWWL